MKNMLAFAIFLLAANVIASPFATEVIDYSPGAGQFVNNPLYNDPARALGAPQGLYTDTPCNDSLVTLGDGGSITLAFDHFVTDDVDNPYGLDFIVFSNAMFIGNDPYYRWQELAFVEISEDAETWYLILPSILPQNLVGGKDTGNSETPVKNYAEFTPTVGLPQDVVDPLFAVTRTPEQLYTVPNRSYDENDETTLEFDFVSGGGDGFDIADAVCQSAPGVPAYDENGNTIAAGIKQFKYIRITDAVVGDKLEYFNEISAEIDAVSDVSPASAIGNCSGYSVITGAVVTALCDGGFVVCSKNIPSAMKVNCYLLPQIGDELTITGFADDKILDNVMYSVTSRENSVKYVGMNISSVKTPLVPYLYVRTWGRVTKICADKYTVSDGACDMDVAGVCDTELGSFVIINGYYDKEKDLFVK